MILHSNNKNYDLKGFLVAERHLNNKHIFELRLLINTNNSFVWADKNNNQQLEFVLEVVDTILEAARKRENTVKIDNLFERIDQLFSVTERSVKRHRETSLNLATIPIIADDSSYVLFAESRNIKPSFHIKRRQAKGYSFEILGSHHYIATVQLDPRHFYTPTNPKHLSDKLLADIRECFTLMVIKHTKNGKIDMSDLLQELFTAYRNLNFEEQLLPI